MLLARADEVIENDPNAGDVWGCDFAILGK
jgi:hypothetical protein